MIKRAREREREGERERVGDWENETFRSFDLSMIAESIKKKKYILIASLRFGRKIFLVQISFVYYSPGCRLINSNRGYLSSLSMVND